MGGHKKKHSHKNKHEGGNALFENPAAMRFLRYYSPETFWSFMKAVTYVALFVLAFLIVIYIIGDSSKVSNSDVVPKVLNSDVECDLTRWHSVVRSVPSVGSVRSVPSVGSVPYRYRVPKIRSWS